jgi:hypothetical protein
MFHTFFNNVWFMMYVSQVYHVLFLARTEPCRSYVEPTTKFSAHKCNSHNISATSAKLHRNMKPMWTHRYTHMLVKPAWQYQNLNNKRIHRMKVTWIKSSKFGEVLINFTPASEIHGFCFFSSEHKWNWSTNLSEHIWNLCSF